MVASESDRADLDSSLLGHILTALQIITKEQPPAESAEVRFGNLLPDDFKTMPIVLISRFVPFTSRSDYLAVSSITGGSVLLAWEPDGKLPWPLRGTQRWNLNDVVRVNGLTLTVEDALSALDLAWNGFVSQRLVDIALIRGEMQRRNVSVSAGESQDAVRIFTAAIDARSSDEVTSWLEDRGLSQSSFELYIRGLAGVESLKIKIAAEAENAYYSSHQSELSLLTVFRGLVRSRRIAEELATCSKIRFYELVDECASSQQLEVSIENVRKHQLSGDDSAVLGPSLVPWAPGPIVTSSGHYCVMRVMAVREPLFDELTRTAVRELIFQEWLAGARESADVHWSWGRA